MKKSLREQIERIHTLTYGKKIVKEGFLDDLLGREVDEQESVASKIDNSKKADAVGKDEQGKEVADPKLLEDFYNTFEKAAASGGLKQQSGGSMQYAKEVESMQIALVLLGYQLPQHGIDGLFGPETAASVQKFATDNKIDLSSTGGTTPTSGATLNERFYTVKQILEAAKLVSQGGSIIGRPGQGTHNASDWQSRNAWDITGPVGSDVYSITTGTVDKVRKGNGQLVQSGVKKIFGDQISIKSSDGKPDMFYTHIETSLTPGSPVKEGDVIGKIIAMDGIPSHVHVGVSTGDLSDLVDELPNAGGGGAGGGTTGGSGGAATGAGGSAVSDTAGRIALGRLGGLAAAEPAAAPTQSGATVNENSQELRSTLASLGYKEKGSEIASGGEISDELSSIVSKVLTDFKKSNPDVKITVTGGNDKFHQGLSYKSKHTEGQAVDMVIDPFNDKNADAFVALLDSYKSKDPKFGYIDEYRHPSGAATAGHFHLQYGEGSGKGGPSLVAMISATPEFLKALLEKVKGLNLTPEKLKEFIKKNVTSGGGGVIDVRDWQGIVNTIIDNLEGGYYHPDMLQDGRIKDGRYGNSGETMFGIDRKTGPESNTPAGQEFWRLIDAEDARSKWKPEYMLKDNPGLANKLREMVAQMMKPEFDQLSRRYLTPESAAIVSKDPALTFHFAYATWNGSGWFQKFARVVNQAVASGTTDPKALLDLAMQNRVSTGNSLMDQVGNKVAKLTSRMPSSSDSMA